MNNINIEQYGYTEFYKEQVNTLEVANNELIPARVIEVHREQYKIVTALGEKDAKLKGSIFYNEDPNIVFPSIGDFVLVKNNPIGEDVIYRVLDRKSKFARMDSFNQKEQVVATNFDYVFIVTSLNYDFNLKRVERYLACAWDSGATPIIVLTKADLCEDYESYISEVEGIAFGVPTIAVSSLTGQGFDQLKQYTKSGNTIVLLGSSGVGKSSLVNAIAEDEVMKVNGIREDDSKGRHTTTHRQLIMLKNGTMIIDTPGMRELEMWVLDEGLSATFSDIEQLEVNCKFTNCKHETEPGCAIKAALETGELTIDRWKNFLKLKKEAAFAEKKAKLLAKTSGGKKKRQYAR
ncbi:ribosome small subunit-dependent GTPase A [Clostridium manihotivorum]|uniref:Small ribosomal subunit biogenesis GTPase RsgA n=1 Tax=Clostridium manihotivorum TaxID=2320868 RepID=A0A3R5TG03_9CLOT|nr:ribosome small subunit-dependent GTPase A [Clostridium manihotivorum]QAA32574.1 ribosome small subunit-dependent GTPase A [Clostridium manihotivorum]